MNFSEVLKMLQQLKKPGRQERERLERLERSDWVMKERERLEQLLKDTPQEETPRLLKSREALEREALERERLVREQLAQLLEETPLERLQRLLKEAPPEVLEKMKSGQGQPVREPERLEQAKDSWVRRLRLDENEHIWRVNARLLVTAVVIILSGSGIGIYFDVLDKFLIPLSFGIVIALLYWLLVGYGDHELRKIRVRKGWYGNNAMEVYELIRFIKKTSEDDTDNGGRPPRRFFEDDEITAKDGLKDHSSVPNGVGVN